MVADNPSITELDLNPILVTPDGACAVDVRLSQHRKEKIFHTNDGVEVFLEAIVTAKAVGRPRYAGD